MNVKLLKRIKKQILKEPRQFFMRRWFTRALDEVDIPNCGTAACIAGWGLALTKKRKPSSFRSWHHQFYLPAPKEIKWLLRIFEIDNFQLERLVKKSNWPVKFQRSHIEGTEAFARQAARRIDHFIKTKGAE